MWLLLLLLNTTAALHAQDVNQAALVIHTAAGETISRCVSFSEPEISGLELLTRSGLAVETSVGGLGAAVCQIAGTGCPAADCFCQCRGPQCVYWSYWQQVDGAWRYGQWGASASRVSPGAVEGWVWGPGTVSEATAPPLLSLAAVCSQETVATSLNNDAAGEESTAADSPSAENETVATYWPYLVLGLVILGLGVVLARRVAR